MFGLFRKRERVVVRELRRNGERLNAAQRIAQLGSWEIHLPSMHVMCSDELYRIFAAKRFHSRQKVLDLDDNEVEVVFDVKLSALDGKLYASEVDFHDTRILRRLGRDASLTFLPLKQMFFTS